MHVQYTKIHCFQALGNRNWRKFSIYHSINNNNNNNELTHKASFESCTRDFACPSRTWKLRWRNRVQAGHADLLNCLMYEYLNIKSIGLWGCHFRVFHMKFRDVNPMELERTRTDRTHLAGPELVLRAKDPELFPMLVQSLMSWCPLGTSFTHCPLSEHPSAAS